MRPFFRKHTLVDFLHIFLEKRMMAPYYSAARNKLLNVSYHQATGGKDYLERDKAYLIYDVPDYLVMEPAAIDDMNFHTVKTFKGSLILLNQYSDLEDFLNKKFSAKRRSQLLGYHKKLHHCFRIKTKIYYGEISKEKYNQIFDAFYEMLNSRFQEKQTKNDDLPHWDKYREIIYPLIIDKKACLSVIYDDDRPISISLNIVYESMIFGYMKSYDIDYSKFGLGFLDLIYLLKWCFEQGIESFDFLKGQYDYKGRWTDHEYSFQKHVLCRSHKVLTNMYCNFLALWIKVFYKIMGALKEKGVHLWYNNLKKARYRMLNGSNFGPIVNFSVKKLSVMPTGHELAEVDLANDRFSHVKRPFYSYLFSYGERKSDTKLFSIDTEPQNYLVQGKKSIVKLEIHPSPKSK